METIFPSLNGEALLLQYPKTTKKIAEWIKANQTTQQVATDEEFKRSLVAVLTWAPRSLYEFFDTQGVTLLVGKIDDHWSYHIEGDLHSYSAESRKVAEEKGFLLAFELEEQK